MMKNKLMTQHEVALLLESERKRLEFYQILGGSAYGLCLVSLAVSPLLLPPLAVILSATFMAVGLIFSFCCSSLETKINDLAKASDELAQMDRDESRQDSSYSFFHQNMPGYKATVVKEVPLAATHQLDTDDTFVPADELYDAQHQLRF